LPNVAVAECNVIPSGSALRVLRFPKFCDFAIKVDLVRSEFRKEFARGERLEAVLRDKLVQVITRIPAANYLAVLFSSVFLAHGKALKIGMAAGGFSPSPSSN